MASLKKVAIYGVVWTLISYGLGNILRLASNLILTRLLYPDLFGLMALIQTIIIGLNLFSDIGFGPNIVQNKRGDEPDFLNTAWTLQILRGFIIWLLCVLLAWPAAKFYGHSELLWLIPVVSLGTLIGGFQGTSIYTLSRHMDFRRQEIFALVEQVISLTVMLLWAWISPSIWALVAGTLTSAFVRLIWTHLLVPGGRNTFAWDKTAVKEFFYFGRWIFFSTAATFLGMQADRIILGKLTPLELLGVYGVAIGFSELPRYVVGAISNKVLLPVISKVADSPRPHLRKVLLKSRNFILLGSALLLSIFASFGDVVIHVLYDARYAQAAWMLPILALGIWPNLLHESVRQSLMALGEPKYEAWGQFLKCLTVCVGIPLAFHSMGILGAVIVVAANDIPLYGAISYGLHRQKLSCLKQDLQMTTALLAILAVLLTGRWLLGFGFPIETLFAP